MILLDPDLDPDPHVSDGKTVRARQRRERRTRLRACLAFGTLSVCPRRARLRGFLAKRRPPYGLRGQVTVLLTTDAAIRKLNRSFAAKTRRRTCCRFLRRACPGAREVAGDLAISVPTARRQAAEQGMRWPSKSRC